MLLSMCNNSFSKHQLCAMERKVLMVNDFKVTSIDPTLFINYYLMKLQIVQEKVRIEWDLNEK